LKFFARQKSSDSRVRRSNRLQWLRLRKIGIYTAFIALLGAGAYTGHQSGSFKKISDWVSTQTLAYSKRAGFKVNDILVTGRVHIPAEELLAHFSIKQNMPIFGVSILDAQKSLAGISWVKSVSVSRRLPDQILVELTERTPAALWQYQKKISVIDQEGAVLTSDNLDVWQKLPLVVGEDAPQHVAELLTLLQAEPAVAKILTAAVRVEGRRWDLRLNNGIAVKLPERDMELALRQLVTLDETKHLLGRDIVAIDMRQPEKIMVTPAFAAMPENKDKKTSI
jgi:cell division protein FtsQ